MKILPFVGVGTGASVFPATNRPPAAAAPPSTLNDGLIHYWSLEEAGGTGTRADSVGAWTLTPVASIPSTTGKRGNTSDLTAVHGTLSKASGATRDFNAVDHTNAFWIYPPTGSALSVICELTGSSDEDFGYNFLTNGNASCFFDDGDANSGSRTFSVTAGQWNLVVTTWDYATRTATVYVNAGAGSSAAIEGEGSLDFTTFYLHGSTQCTAGSIDEVAMWDRKLTTDEITELYNSGTGKFYPF